MDNSTRRKLTPYFVIGVCSKLHLIQNIGGGGALGCSIAAFPQVYASNEFVFCCPTRRLLYMIYDNAGCFDYKFLTNLRRPTGARGRFGWAVKSILAFFCPRDKKPIEADEEELGDFSDGDEDDEGMVLDDIKPKDDDDIKPDPDPDDDDDDDDDDEKPPPWWLSLAMGLAACGAEAALAIWRLMPLVDDGLLDAIGDVPGLEVYKEYYGGQWYQIVVARPYRGVQHLVDAWGARPTMADLLGRKAVKMSDLRRQLPRLETPGAYQEFAARVRAEGNVNSPACAEDWQV
ncbi:unnamed protein product [Pelagomonas calceolata]|uniref:Uncharacterized protein n=1 Tax=Pelagomonas calceolata TaxID=35677 RepID=A0A8J2WVU2_9STRA|nr:unnamed protein product [Pelagomonas calceolata]